MQSKFVDKKKEHSWGCSLPGSESKCTYSKHKLKTCHITTNVVSCMDSQASKPACKVVLHSQCTMQDGWMDGWVDGWMDGLWTGLSLFSLYSCPITSPGGGWLAWTGTAG
jgi:hypothetical protein